MLPTRRGPVSYHLVPPLALVCAAILLVVAAEARHNNPETVQAADSTSATAEAEAKHRTLAEVVREASRTFVAATLQGIRQTEAKAVLAKDTQPAIRLQGR